MTVRELIELLEDQDQDATVLIMSQPSWPFEHEVRGVAARADFAEVDPDGDPADRRRPEDVFLVEGGQLRYGDKAAWDAV